jgi:bacteriocin-like protein
MSDHQDPKVEIETLNDDDLDSVSGGLAEVSNTGTGTCKEVTNSGTGTCQ